MKTHLLTRGSGRFGETVCGRKLPQAKLVTTKEAKTTCKRCKR